MIDDLVTELAQRIDAPAGRYERLDRYYIGEQPLAFLAPEARAALGNRLASVNANVCRLLVDSIAERLRVTGLTNSDAWQAWQSNDLDQLSHLAHREALALGDCFVLVWADAAGRPLISIESAKQCAVLTDPGSRQIVAGMKRWTTRTTTEAVVYEPDKITRLRAETPGATTAGYKIIGELGNPLDVPPIVRLRNGGRLPVIDPNSMDVGSSELTDLLPLQDGLTKLLTDMLVSSEYGARPRRWATGVELAEDDQGNAVNPFPESDRMMISEAPDSKFGQLASSDLAGYETAVAVIMRQISAVTGLPEHALGIGADNPTSADAIRASEASLTARAEARQQTFGKSWEQVARLAVAVAEGVDPATVDVRVRWADPSTRSAAQEADAVVKLFVAGVLPREAALARLGYSSDEITEMTAGTLAAVA